MKTIAVLLMSIFSLPGAQNHGKAVKRVAKAAPAPAAAPVTATTPSNPQVRSIVVGPKDLIPVRLRVNFSAMLVLPATDSILEVTCGDKDAWVVNGADNVVHVKPTRENLKTNLNVISRSGRYFSFVLSEISNEKGEPDLKLLIEPKEELFVVQRPAPVIRDENLQALRQELQTTKTKLEEETKRRREYPWTLNFGYKFDFDTAPFFIKAIYDDGVSTFIRANPAQAPTLYDGNREPVQFTLREGVYAVSRVVDSGSLVLGRKTSYFRKR